MRVAVWPADDAGCGNYRLKFPASALAAQGADVHIDLVGPKIIWSHPWEREPGPTHRVFGLAEPYPADVVVIQRPARRWWADLIPHLQAQGTRVVVDVDDLFDEIPKANVAWNDHQGPVVNHRFVDEACRLADVVTVTTPRLLRRYGHGHGVVLPNLVPESYLSVFGLKRERTVGWSGFVGTHPGDLQATDGGVAAALLGTDWRFHVIGAPQGVPTALGLERGHTTNLLGTRIATDRTLGARFSWTGPVPFAEYPMALAELEVGIVPLECSAFNEAKSALKASEMAALGVPVVMSPSPDNLRLHELGIGFVAESRSQWRRLVGKLIADVDFRYEVAERQREVMAGQTYEAHCGRWLQAWQGEIKEEAA